MPSQASDRAFKQELAKLVDLRVWEAAKEASRRELSSRWAVGLGAGAERQVGAGAEGGSELETGGGAFSRWTLGQVTLLGEPHCCRAFQQHNKCPIARIVCNCDFHGQQPCTAPRQCAQLCNQPHLS